MTERVVVHVRGGLGNQLCSYAAGWLAARRFKADLVVSGAAVARSRDPSRRFQLHRFKWPASVAGQPVVRIGPSSGVGARVAVGARALRRSFPRLFSAEMRATADDLLRQGAARTVVLDGHFEDLTLVRQSVGQGLPLPVLPRPQQGRASEFRESVAVHIRLGDYRTAWGGKLLLHPEYYAAAFDVVRRHVDVGRVDVFSDEPEVAVSLLEHIGLSRDLLDADQPTEPVTALTRLASYRYKILSRSTFSWWAGLLTSDDSALVLSPCAQAGDVVDFRRGDRAIGGEV